MAEAPSSPAWKRPSKVLKVLKRRKKPVDNASNKTLASASPSSESQASKRKNPFSCHGNLQEKKVSMETNPQADSDGFFSTLHSVSVNKTTKSPSVEVDRADSFSMPSSTGVNGVPANDTPVPSAENTEDVPVSATYPMDWGLKSRMIVHSNEPFKWCCQLKSSEESRGLDAFVRSQQNRTEAKEHFHSCCMLWMHPHIPWLNMFPRMVPDKKIGKSSSLTKDEEVLASLQSTWAQSFSSLFQQLSAGFCSYFYLCSHQFTVLFKHFDGAISACITPTTRGLRQLLTDEGIEFQLPLEKAPTEESAESIDEVVNEEPDSIWLQDLGLDQKKFKALDPDRIKAKASRRDIDDHAESTVTVSTAHDTVALFNFLLNYKNLCAQSGGQYGLPPTLLSPNAFKAAVIETLKIRSSIVNTEKARRHRLEVIGPLLPSNCQQLVSSVRSVHPQASVAFTSVEETSAFNCTTDSLQTHADCHSEKLGKKTMRQLTWSSSGFKWKSY